MWVLFLTSAISTLSYIIFKAYNFLNVDKTIVFDNKYVKSQKDKDEYNLICYRVVFTDKDKEDELFTDITNEDIEDMNKDDEIRFIITEYMFNGRLCKHISYDKKIVFPIYNFTIQNTEWEYYPEYFFLGNINITDYVRPYMGPAYNFYMDTDNLHYLKDILYDHPDIDKFEKLIDDNDKLYMITNDTPISGVKLLIKDPTKYIIFKRHASVDPRDLHLLGLKLDIDQNIIKE